MKLHNLIFYLRNAATKFSCFRPNEIGQEDREKGDIELHQLSERAKELQIYNRGSTDYIDLLSSDKNQLVFMEIAQKLNELQYEVLRLYLDIQ